MLMTCDLCEATFSTFGQLSSHTLECHWQFRACEWCKRLDFMTTMDLANHAVCNHKIKAKIRYCELCNEYVEEPSHVLKHHLEEGLTWEHWARISIYLKTKN